MLGQDEGEALVITEVLAGLLEVSPLEVLQVVEGGEREGHLAEYQGLALIRLFHAHPPITGSHAAENGRLPYGLPSPPGVWRGLFQRPAEQSAKSPAGPP